MMRFLLAVARFALPAWVGAAVLFVVVGVQEVRSTDFDSVVRDRLVGLRFPSFYVFGFTLVGISFLSLLATGIMAGEHKRRQFALAGAVLLALAVMVADYFWVYRPLLEMITPPGQSRPASFLAYHNASKWLNLFSITVCAVVGAMTCGIEARKT